MTVGLAFAVLFCKCKSACCEALFGSHMLKSVLPPPQVPDWFLNRQRDFRDGKTSQIVSSTVDSKLREDFERLKKIRCTCSPFRCLLSWE